MTNYKIQIINEIFFQSREPWYGIDLSGNQ